MMTAQFSKRILTIDSEQFAECAIIDPLNCQEVI